MEGIVGPILELLFIIWSPIHDCWTNHRGLDNNMQDLRSKAQALNSQKEDVVSRLKAEKTTKQLTRMVTKKEVGNWFERVTSINKQVQDMEQEYSQVKCLTRACLGKRVCEKIEKLKELHVQGDFNGRLVVGAPSNYEITTVELFGETATRKMQEILTELTTVDDVRKIGVCGMAGIGKTIIVKNVYNSLMGLKKDGMCPFNYVIWVDALEAVTLGKLQQEVAHALERYEFDFSKYEGETRRAAIINAILGKDKWLLIFDDIWEEFQLEDVGIPEPTLANGCKILLTTRKVEVCRRMDCKEINVRFLTKEEAWNLFLDKVGRNDVLCDSKIEAIARKVADECACLPLAIVTIAASMKGADIRAWRHVLRELKKSTKGHKSKDEVLAKIKISYDRLQNEKILQQCLLYCAFYPKSFEIEKEELIAYLVAERIIEGKDSRQAEIDHGYIVLKQLQDASLLETFNKGKEYVRMHDLVRAMTIQIMPKGDLVKAGEHLSEWPNDEKLWKKKPKRVSLMHNYISEVQPILPLHGQRLQTLLLARNADLATIPNSFFLNMPCLRVLDLSYTGIINLPNSIFDLEQLTALFLRYCEKLRNIPSLAKLGALRELDMRYTGIKELPQGMDMLINLRYLNICIKDLEILPLGILSKLSQLQCVLLWLGSGTVRVKGEELESLRKLEVFEGQLYDVHNLNACVRSMGDRELNEYILKLGQKEWQKDQDFGKAIIVIEYNTDDEEAGEILLLPVDVEYLSILSCQNLRLSYVSSSNGNTDFSSHRKNVEHDGTLFVPLPSSAVVTHTKGGPAIQTGAFSLLKVLKIENCHDLKAMFGLLPPLLHLEEFVIYDCQQMEEILATVVAEKYAAEMCAESSSRNKQQYSNTLVFEFPKLRVFSLSKLPELKSICPGLVYCPSIVYITIDDCPKLKTLPLAPHIDDSILPLPDLQCIYVNDELWWESLEWHLPNFKNVLQPFVGFLDQDD